MKYIILDTETTGTDPVRNGIIQLSGNIIIPTKDHEVVFIDEPFDLKMQPFPADIIEDSALAVTGTTREELATRMLCFDGYKEFTRLLGRHISKFDRSDKAFMVGYNIGFDDSFLRQWFQKAGDRYFGSWFWWPPIDVAVLAAMKLRDRRAELPDFKQGTVAKALGIEVDETRQHNALYDVNICRQIYNVCTGEAL
ncbi:MAG: 3'-5' exonuclease [Dehalococcoidia bacterium]|jgi:DNA polymerase-3 subunit epsilon